MLFSLIQEVGGVYWDGYALVLGAKFNTILNSLIDPI